MKLTSLKAKVLIQLEGQAEPVEIGEIEIPIDLAVAPQKPVFGHQPGYRSRGIQVDPDKEGPRFINPQTNAADDVKERLDEYEERNGRGTFRPEGYSPAKESNQ